jgi:hypothetical protein
VRRIHRIVARPFPERSEVGGYQVLASGKRVPTQTLATRYDLLRHRLADGEDTTVYVVRFPRPPTTLSVEHFAAP